MWADSRGTERHLFSVRHRLQADRDTKKRERERESRAARVQDVEKSKGLIGRD